MQTTPAITRRCFRTLLISHVPPLTVPLRDEARRLVTLVDLAYDTGVRLVLASQAPAQQLFAPLLDAAMKQVRDCCMAKKSTAYHTEHGCCMPLPLWLAACKSRGSETCTWPVLILSKGCTC